VEQQKNEPYNYQDDSNSQQHICFCLIIKLNLPLLYSFSTHWIGKRSRVCSFRQPFKNPAHC
jgi:hypothetical protein